MPTITVTPEMASLLDQETSAAVARADQAERCLDEHGYGCARVECGRGPATSADLLELDAVPEPVDSDAPAEVHAPGCAPIGPTAKTRPYRVPAIEADVHARTLARART